MEARSLRHERADRASDDSRYHHPPVEGNWLSTADVAQPSDMTHHPYDDATGYERRWTHPDPAQVTALRQAQPLLFVADHISIFDRCDGSLAVYARTADAKPLMIVIADAEPAPDADACLRAVIGIADRLVRHLGLDLDDVDWSSPPFVTLGLVHHRRGRPHISDLDRHWAQALSDVCSWLNVQPAGVLTRTESGALVPVPLPIPRDPDVLDAIA